MRLTRLLRSRPSLDDVPVHHIAELIEAATTARLSTVAVYRNPYGQKFKLHESGVEDFAEHLTSLRRKQDGAERLFAAGDVLRRIPKKEQTVAGKVWRWEGHTCPYQKGERAETAASLRLNVAEPRAATVETVDGERLQRYSFRVEAQTDHEDVVIARMFDHMRHHQYTRVSFDVWLGDDGDLRRTRESAKLHHLTPDGYVLLGHTAQYWEFGVPTGIVAPSPEQILRPPAEQGPSR